MFDFYGGLRRDEIDVRYYHFPVKHPNLTAGPALARYELFLAVMRGHRLAGRDSVSIEDLGDEEVARIPSSFPSWLRDIYLPPLTPTGRPIRRTHPVRTINEALWLVAQGGIVYPVILPQLSGWNRDDIVLVPFTDLGPAVLGLIWRTGNDGVGIRALAAVARSLSPDRGVPINTEFAARTA